MDNNRKELIRKIQTLGEVYTILSRATRLPYVICDPESFNDQVWICLLYTSPSPRDCS